MSVTGKLEPEIRGWVGIGILIVIGSVILLKFKAVSGVTTALNTTIDAVVSGLSEPSSWVAIAVIALVGFAMFSYAKSKK